MKKFIFIFIGVITLVFSNSSSLIDDGAKLIKCATRSPVIDDANLVVKAGRLSKVTQKALTLSKVDNIQNLMSLKIL